MKEKVSAPAAPGLMLSKASLIKIEGMNEGAELLCLSGSVHVKEEGSFKDYFLKAGETYVIDRVAVFLIQALEDSRISIENSKSPSLLQLKWSRRQLFRYLALILAVAFMVSFLWIRPDLNRSDLPGWKTVFGLAEEARKKADLYQARTLYSQAGQLAAWHEDWQGLLAAACGLTKLRPEREPFSRVNTLLHRAMIAAEFRQSRSGISAVAHAFAAMGEHTAAAKVLSQVKTHWPHDIVRIDEAITDCWNVDARADQPIQP